MVNISKCHENSKRKRLPFPVGKHTMKIYRKKAINMGFGASVTLYIRRSRPGFDYGYYTENTWGEVNSSIEKEALP